MSSEKKWVLVLGAAAVVLRLAYAFWGTSGRSVVDLPGQGHYGGDASYLALANNWILKDSYEATMVLISPEGFTYKAIRPPLFPAFLVLVSYVHGMNPVMPARIYLSLLSMVVPLCVGLLARRLWSWREGVVAFAWACFHPHFVFYSGLIVPETLFIVCSTSAVTLMVMQKSALQAAAAGALTGLACLCRSQFAGASLIGMVWPFVTPNPGARKIWSAAFLGGFLLAVSPWWIRNYGVFHKFMPFSTEGGYTLWLGANPLSDGGGDCYPSNPPRELGELGMDKWHYRQAFSYMKEEPGRMFYLAFQKLRRFWGIVPLKNVSDKIKVISFASFLPLLVLSLAGFWLWRSRFREVWPVVALIAYYTAVQSVFPSMIRYRLVLEPFLIAAAAAAAVRLADRVSKA